MTTESRYSHYYKDVSGLSHIDVYRVLLLFGVSDPCVQHAIKKLLCAGLRGGKDQSVDVEEAIATLQRWQAMRAEDLGKAKGEPQAVGHIGSTLDVERMARTGEVAATEPPEPRAIVVGSKVRCSFDNGTVDATVVRVDYSKIPYLVEYYEMKPVSHKTWADAKSVTWVSDPPAPVCPTCNDTHVATITNRSGDAVRVNCTHCPTPCDNCRAGGIGAYCEHPRCECACHRKATPAPELPRKVEQCHECGGDADTHRVGCSGEGGGAFGRVISPAAPASRKVEPGTTLTVGARYRITEIASWDRTPENKVGHVFTCDSSDGWADVALTPSWSTRPAWLVADGTYVTGLELVAEPGEGE